MTERSRTRAKIKLLVVSQYFYPEQFRINDICAEWVKREYDVTVVTGIPNYPQGRFYSGYGRFRKRRETHDGVKIIRLPIISRGNSKVRLGWNYLSFVVSGFFWQLFTKQKADLVFSFEVSPMTQVLPAVWLANRRRIPCIVYVQDLWPENLQELTGIKDGFIVNQITRMTNYIYHQCKLILVTSSSFKKVIEDRGVPAEKVVFWPQYAEEIYKPSEIISPLVSPDDRFTIAYTGNIGSAQGLEILPRTAAILKQHGSRVRFLLVGDGRGKQALVDEIEYLKVMDYFSFLPQQPPEVIPSILAGVDVVFLSFADKPFFQKTIPAKLQSYMACGKPIIAALDGEARQAIIDAGCGICVDSGKADELVKAIASLMGSPPGQLIEYGIRARAYSKIYYSKAMLLNKIDTIFQDLLGRRG